jgi:hypothetical protein
MSEGYKLQPHSLWLDFTAICLAFLKGETSDRLNRRASLSFAAEKAFSYVLRMR